MDTEFASPFYCHDCRTTVLTNDLADGTYQCGDCGSTILCDYCGTEYTDDHDCN
jgi:DNA-directed RNA polymerase subunit RPC12/RpoP